uniref:helix-turn-helix domain-containing protein n=1 Tax=Paenibacillus sp. TaxID=58172 RepID=UPI001CD83BE6|nr:helix-turn-helix transcriptional regulator [Paenibacillus sp.]
MLEGVTIVGINEAITTRVRLLCKEKGWTINELIRRSNVKQSTVAEIMSGRSKYPTIITLVKLANGFGITLSEFFDDDLFLNLNDYN